MNSVSYCVTCKGRLWQLKQTLPVNIDSLGEECDIIILDYHSEDETETYIKKNYSKYLESGVLKYYKMLTPVSGFDMAFAKHIVHLLSDNDVVFNLDADNYIGETLLELQSLKVGEVLLPKMLRNSSTSRSGRIGVHKKDYVKVDGYNLSIRGMSNDDGDFIRRLFLNKIKPIFSIDTTMPIQQTPLEKNKYKNELQDVLPINISVVDYRDETIKLNLITGNKL